MTSLIENLPIMLQNVHVEVLAKLLICGMFTIRDLSNSGAMIDLANLGWASIQENIGTPTNLGEKAFCQIFGAKSLEEALRIREINILVSRTR